MNPCGPKYLAQVHRNAKNYHQNNTHIYEETGLALNTDKSLLRKNNSDFSDKK